MRPCHGDFEAVREHVMLHITLYTNIKNFFVTLIPHVINVLIGVLRATYFKHDGDAPKGHIEGNDQAHHTRAVNVILLLHLIRGDDEFQLTFDTRWTCAFVDSIGDGASSAKRQSGLLDATGKSVLDVASDLDPSQVQTWLAWLHYLIFS